MDWDRIRDVFVRARELSGDAREDMLRRVELDAGELDEGELREVRALLVSDDEDFLATPALGSTFRVPRLSKLAGSMPERIGDYTVLDVLGEGASAIVYLASQQALSSSDSDRS